MIQQLPFQVSVQRKNTTDLKKHQQFHVHCSSIYNIQDVEPTYMSIYGGMDKNDVLHSETHGCAHSHNEIMQT